MGHFANWSFHLQHTSPIGHFAEGTFRLLDSSPMVLSGYFAYKATFKTRFWQLKRIFRFPHKVWNPKYVWVVKIAPKFGKLFVSLRLLLEVWWVKSIRLRSNESIISVHLHRIFLDISHYYGTCSTLAKTWCFTTVKLYILACLTSLC